jgi:hypothetical protein
MKPNKTLLASLAALGVLAAMPSPAFAIYYISNSDSGPGPDPGFTTCQQAGTCTPPAPPPVPSGTVTSDTSYFEGYCSDCTGLGTAELILQNYTLGNELTNANFVGFSYSSNLTSYTISQLYSLSGVLGGSSNETLDLELEGSGLGPYGDTGFFFNATTTGMNVGNWNTGTTELPNENSTRVGQDMGVGFTFTTAASA